MKALELLWKQRQWPVRDLRELYQKIENDGFRARIIYGKVLMSPDKQHKVEFYCELYADHAEYYLWFAAKQNKWRRKIKFLQWHEDPEVFFWNFTNRRWKDNEQFVLSDRNEEILFVFDVHKDDFAVEYRLKEVGEKKIRLLGLLAGERSAG